MPVLKVAPKGAAVPPAGPAASSGARSPGASLDLSLDKPNAMENLPLSSISVVGRIHMIYGTQSRYPPAKWILAGESTATPVFVVKFSGVPPDHGRYSVDMMVRLANVEVRSLWKKANGTIPEQDLFENVSGKELAVNVPKASSGKRRRTGTELLGLILCVCFFFGVD